MFWYRLQIKWDLKKIGEYSSTILDPALEVGEDQLYVTATLPL
jgi:hypothetical protein